MGFKFIHPSTHLVAGHTGCGKTQYVLRILSFRMIEPFPDRIIWVYAEWQSAYAEELRLNPKIEFVKGYPPNLYDRILPTTNNLVILDDQMSEAGEKKELAQLFTQGSHHRNLSIIYIVQNVFDKGKSHRTASLNSHYITLFKNPRDQLQVETLARQVFPGQAKRFSGTFHSVTSEPFTYMLLDVSPRAGQARKRSHSESVGYPSKRSSADLYSGIFPDEETFMYFP